MNDAAKGFLHRIQRTPRREAVYDVSTDTRYTYCDVGRRALKLARFLTDDLGLTVGDVIALVSENCIAFIDAFYASCMTGVIITTYNGRLHQDDIVPLVQREEPKVVIVSESYRSKMNSVCESAGMDPVVVSIDGGVDCFVKRYDEIMAQHVDPLDFASLDNFVDFDIENTMMLVHTGGTTGLPKSAMISYRAILFNAMSEILTVSFTQRDVGLVFLPFFHTVGWNVVTLPLLLAGGRIILTPTLDPGVLLHLIHTEHPTTGLAVESIFLRMAEHPAFDETDFTSYRLITNGAGPIGQSTMKRYWDHGVRLVNGYGMTETGPNNCFYPDMDASLDHVRAHSTTVGKVMCFNELKIVDEDGAEVPIGCDGELLWRGPITFSGYWRNPEATKAVMTEDGWVRSGDMGHVDEFGYVYLRGRRKNMIITNGENIFPIEIENVLRAHPDVEECCVIAVPDSRRGEVGKALVRLRDGAELDRESLRSWAKGQLASIKVPVYYTQVDQFPQHGLKVNLTELKERYGFAGD